MGSKNNPGDFDCYANALPDEPMFILLARDPGAPLLVEAWAVGRLKDIERGLRPDTDMSMVSEAQQCAANMRKWRTDNDGAWRKPSPSPAPHAGVTEEMVEAALDHYSRRDLESPSTWMYKALTAALQSRPASAVGEEEIARVLYEAEYDADEYPWSNRKPSEKALYYQQARAVFALIERRS
jgi:hypothetical protein